MNLKIKESNRNNTEHIVYCIAEENYNDILLSTPEKEYVAQEVANKSTLVEINRYTHKIFVCIAPEKATCSSLEQMRKMGYQLHQKIQASRISEITFIDELADKSLGLALLEGLVLSNYQFIKYLKDTKTIKHTLNQIEVVSDHITISDLDELTIVCDAVKAARDLVNEPLSFLNAAQLSKEINRLSKDAGFTVQTFGKSEIEQLKMGGLLAVNQGSIDDPQFSILEWKPSQANNAAPIVFVGKGIVYDTGGLSLKPTPDSMDSMKSDMGGAAAVIGAVYAIAKAKLPMHVIGLVPATDNRPSGNAYAPGDIITMHNGLSVEVLNTDAEGRLILADALSYAHQYQPEFVVDLATLTGAAAVAIGKYGVVAMGNKSSQNKMEQLKEAGNNVYERVVEFPFWEEYGELIKSDIADLKNLGGREGGAITAGKFLEHFTNYPWIHIDIAGPAFVTASDNYRGKGGTGDTCEYNLTKVAKPYFQLGKAFCQGGKAHSQSGKVFCQGGKAHSQLGKAFCQGGKAYSQLGKAFCQGGKAHFQSGKAFCQGGKAYSQLGKAFCSWKKHFTGVQSPVSSWKKCFARGSKKEVSVSYFKKNSVVFNFLPSQKTSTR